MASVFACKGTVPCYRYQLRNFAQWMETEQGKIELDDVTAIDLLAYKQSLSHTALPKTLALCDIFSSTMTEPTKPFITTTTPDRSRAS